MSKCFKMIKDYVEDIRAYEVACFGPSHDKGGRCDPVADVSVVMDGKDIVMTFDGAGFHHFSELADYPQQYAWHNRETMQRLSERLGYIMQPVNAYTLRFVALSDAQ